MRRAGSGSENNSVRQFEGRRAAMIAVVYPETCAQLAHHEVRSGE